MGSYFTWIKMILFETRCKGVQTRCEPDARSQNNHVVNVAWHELCNPCLSHTADITLPWEGLRTFFGFYFTWIKMILFETKREGVQTSVFKSS